MSFHTTIARLREASYAAPAAGEDPNTCRVGRHDLRTALHVIDRLDADLRQAGELAQGAMDAAARQVSAHVADARLRGLHGLVEQAISWIETGGGRADSLCADLRKALASAQVDPEAAEVDFMIRVFENLDTWRVEDWNELIERRPAILALLRPLVLASAPVAGHQPYPAMPEPDVTHPGEQEDSYSRAAVETAMRAAHDRGYSVGWDHGKEHASAPVAGEAQKPVAWANWKVGTDSYVPYRTREKAQACVRRSAIAATQEGPYEVAALYAAPQASEAARDAAINDAISILLNLSARYRHNYDKEGCNSYHEGGADALDEAEQAIRAALSAQPGAQKEQSDE